MTFKDSAVVFPNGEDRCVQRKIKTVLRSTLKGHRMNRVVTIGLDGVPYRLLRDLSDRGIMHHIKRLRENGSFTKMTSTIPEVSSVAWSSIFTGKNPGEHGIYGFTDLIEGTYSISYHSSLKLKVAPFWQRDQEKTYALLNLPATYPASEINGLLVSGFVAPDLERAVYPRRYLNKLKELEYAIDIDAQRARKSHRLLFKKLFDTLKSRIRAYRFFWKHLDWNVFMLIFTGTDRLEHYLWNAYQDERHEYHQKFLDFFARIDEIIGEIMEKLEEGDALLLLSDHGMEGITTNVNLNAYLAKEGFLQRGEDPKKGFNNIKEGTQAFTLDPARIYLNKEEKYPRGSVEEAEEETIIENLMSSLRQLSWHGTKVIKEMFRKEEVYHGAHTGKAPDLVLEPHSGFKLKGGLLKTEIFEQAPLTGKHTRNDAFLLVKGKDHADLLPKRPSVEDYLSIVDGLST